MNCTLFKQEPVLPAYPSISYLKMLVEFHSLLKEIVSAALAVEGLTVPRKEVQFLLTT